MINIHHIAIWVKDLERMKDFYSKYFGCTSSSLYQNPKKGFSSYFVAFEHGAKIELMKKEGLDNKQEELMLGLAHFAIAVGSELDVDKLTSNLENDGYEITGKPRTTGDGYYESVFLDPEGNTIELVANC